MATPLLDTEDFVAGGTPQIERAMLTVFRAWPFFELVLTQMLMLEYELDEDTAPLLLGNMDTRNKLDKLVAVAKLRGHSNMLAAIKAVSKAHQQHVRIRNILAHNPLAGHLRSEPDKALFLTLKRERGLQRMESLTVAQMKASADFAYEIGAKINQMLEKRQSGFPEAPQEDPAPTPPE